MSDSNQTNPIGTFDRRAFVKATAAGLAVTTLPGIAWAHSYGEDTIGVGVIGCGGRGTGAALNAMQADPSVRIVAMGDLFRDRLDGSRKWLSQNEQFGSQVEVTDDLCFTGFDAYKHVIAQKPDYVILATPPHFRPIHFKAAIKAGLHVFMEKPVAVDPAGVRTVIASGESGEKRGLCVVAGTQRRHEASYLDAMRQVRDGGIGDVVSARCYWNQGGLWVKNREPDWTDMEWQVRNWLYFTWLSGDHICEQHIHNLDFINWVMGGPPVRCMGMGGREVRTGLEYGHIFDHFAIEYEYEGGQHLMSMCRQIDGCASRVQEIVHGTSGKLITSSNSAVIEGAREWRAQKNPISPYIQEHKDLIEAIRSGETLNEARRVGESTLTAIMGRMSTYTGQALTWEQAMNSQLDLTPPAYEFGPLPETEVAVPGRTQFV